MQIHRISGGDVNECGDGSFDDEGDALSFPASYTPVVAAVLDLDPLGALQNATIFACGTSATKCGLIGFAAEVHTDSPCSSRRARRIFAKLPST